MITRFDHAIVAVGSLAPTATRVRARLGFDVREGGRHAGLGTENATLRFGLDYIEYLGVHDRQEVADAGIKRASLLDYVDSEGGGWLAFCMATDDIDELAQRFQQVGLEARGPYAMRRQRPDGVTLTWRLLHPEGTAWRRPWPFFIQWDMPDEERLQIESPGDHRMASGTIMGVRVVVRDIRAASYFYSEQLGFEPDGRGICVSPGAETACFRLGDFAVELIMPSAPGPAMEELEARGEGLKEVVLAADEMALARDALYRYAMPGASACDFRVDLLQAESPDRCCAPLCLR